jgi:PAS domain S-box-containing protein
VTDLDGTIEYMNPAMHALTGFGPAEAIGRSPRLWTGGTTPASTYVEMWSTILAGQTWRGELQNRHRTDGPFDAGLTIAPIPSPDDRREITGFAGIQHDISLRKKAEADIQRAFEREREVGELRTQFVSMVSHEFRTPLATILSSTELMEHYGDGWPGEKKKVHFSRVKTAVGTMTRLLEDVLVLGKAASAQKVVNPDMIDLAEFCREVVEEMQLGVGSGRSIRYAAGESPFPAKLDRKLLRQALENLVSNAIKYSPAGGPVTVELVREGDRVRLRVSDEGIGIPEADRGRLFEAFHRAGNVGEIPGTGLGLSIVKAAVDLHSGTIEVLSREDQGTIVNVTLPLGIATVEPLELSEPSEPAVVADRLERHPHQPRGDE